MPLPVMTPEQRAGALQKAAAARAAKSAALAKVRSGEVTITAVLADQDSPLQRARVRQVLLAVPRIGQVTADKLLADLGIDPKRRIAGLGPRQREALRERLAA